MINIYNTLLILSFSNVKENYLLFIYVVYIDREGFHIDQEQQFIAIEENNFKKFSH